MQLTDHTDLGLRTLMLLAARDGERLPVATIARWHGLSYTHLQKVVQSLQAAGLVHTFRGRNGGVCLARPAAEIRVGEVVRALEPHFQMAECFRPGVANCRLAPACALTGVLGRGVQAMLTELDRHTLAEVTQGSVALHGAGAR